MTDFAGAARDALRDLNTQRILAIEQALRSAALDGFRGYVAVSDDDTVVYDGDRMTLHLNIVRLDELKAPDKGRWSFFNMAELPPMGRA